MFKQFDRINAFCYKNVEKNGVNSCVLNKNCFQYNIYEFLSIIKKYIRDT